MLRVRAVLLEALAHDEITFAEIVQADLHRRLLRVLAREVEELHDVLGCHL